MKPRGQLMIEHRLIEKVLIVANNAAQKFNENSYDPLLIDKIVDFIRTYADRTHHGKEEDILFMELGKKKMDSENVNIMNELIEEHKMARVKVREIVALNGKYKNGDKKVVFNISEIISWLAKFYPKHIEKEDKVFFPNSEKYFSSEELDEMLINFNNFDKNMIHEKYQNVYKELSN
jgi:hemerythrin-like domain-containing protein